MRTSAVPRPASHRRKPILGLRRKPGRLALSVFRMPLLAYRHDAGWLLGRTFMEFTHVGRKTGKPYQAVAMVLRYDPIAHEAAICAGWGPETDWVRNLRAGPPTQVRLGRESFTPQHRFLSDDEAYDVAVQFRREHPWRLRLITTILGWGDFWDDAAVRDFIRTHPFVAFRPATSALPPPGSQVPEATRDGPWDNSPGQPLVFDLSVAVRRPPAAVFAFLSDVQEHEPIPGRERVRMTKLPPGPTVIGTRWRELVRLAPAWWMSADSTVTDVSEPTLLGMNFRSMWGAGHLTYRIEATQRGSILHQHENLRPAWPLRWLAARIDAGLRPHLLTRLAEIRALLESA